jgi:phosphinothricin acetyltransferase
VGGVVPVDLAREEHLLRALRDDAEGRIDHRLRSDLDLRPRECYRGVEEASVYVAREARSRGAGRLALQALIDAATDADFWKLVSRGFPGNTASRRLIRACGFREVGVYEKHARIEGVWRDVIIVERLLSVGDG